MKKKTLGFFAVDQDGQYYHGLQNPRKDLLAMLGCQHAQKMLCNTKDGKSRHVGYIIAGRWLDVFRICEWKDAK